MAQVTTVIQADPTSFAAALNTLAAANEIQIISKTGSSGKFLVVYDNAGTTGQVASVIAGDPDKLSSDIAALIALPSTVEIVTQTFSASHYVVVRS